MSIEIDEIKLKEIKEDALLNHVPILSDDSLNVIQVLLDMIKPCNILEIGTAVGYSASNFARYLNTNKECLIKTIERNEKRYNKAIENINSLKLNKYIDVVFDDAVEYLQNLKEDNKYDVIFIDAAKGQYLKFLDESKRLIKNGGVIIADNVFFKGRVLNGYNEHRNRTATVRLRKYLEVIQNDKSFNSTVLNVGDGLAITVVNKDNE